MQLQCRYQPRPFLPGALTDTRDTEATPSFTSLSVLGSRRSLAGGSSPGSRRGCFTGAHSHCGPSKMLSSDTALTRGTTLSERAARSRGSPPKGHLPEPWSSCHVLLAWGWGGHLKPDFSGSVPPSSPASLPQTCRSWFLSESSPCSRLNPQAMEKSMKRHRARGPSRPHGPSRAPRLPQATLLSGFSRAF